MNQYTNNFNNTQPNNNYQQPIQQPIQNSINNLNSQNNNEHKNKNTGPIMVIAIGLVIIIAVVMVMFKGNSESENTDNDAKNNSNNNEETEQIVDENYIADWKDFTVYVQGVEFNFPMTFDEFENKISKTSYKINKESDKEKKIYGKSFSTSNYITYTNTVREYNYSTGKHGLYYDISVYLQNMNDEASLAKDCMVIGFQVKDIVWISSNDTDSTHDKDVYFTKSKLYLGQETTKDQLQKKFGPANGNSTAKIYSAGSFTSAFYSFPKFQCTINDNTITYLSIINFIEEQD